MKSQYQVGAAPRHRCNQLAFSTFSLTTTPHEPARVARVVVMAESEIAQEGSTEQQQPSTREPASHQAVAFIHEILQEESALPVVRRLVEALRHTNHALHRQKQYARVIAGVIIGNTLFVTCVGNASAYLLRQGQPALLLRADRSRDQYLGRSLQLWLDCHVQVTTNPPSLQGGPTACALADRFMLAPGDTVIFCTSELPLEQLQTAARYARQPERLAGYLADLSTCRADGLYAAVVAVHWPVNTLLYLIQQLLLVLAIFLSVTLSMQGIVYFNGRASAWMETYSTAHPAPPPIVIRPTAAATVSATTEGVVKVNVTVNVDGATGAAEPEKSAPEQRILEDAVSQESVRATANNPSPSGVDRAIPLTSPLHATILSPELATLSSTATPLLVPTIQQAPVTTSEGAPFAITLLAPEDSAGSSNQITFAWQGDGYLPAGYGYEVVLWREGQMPMRDGLAIAPPSAAQRVPVQWQGLQHTMGLLAPGAYRWGVLLVQIEPYTRLKFLGGREFRFEAAERTLQ